MTMRVRHVSRPAGYLAAVTMLLICGGAPHTLAQADHQHAMTPQQPMSLEQKARANMLVKAVRQATEPYQTPDMLPRDFQLLFGCVSGGELGAMGMHYVNLARVGDGEIDINNPEIVLYEPTPGGKIKITGADYLVYASDWDAKHPGDPPQLGGQLFHLFDSPNRFGLPPFYTLHVWAWKDNPNGTFTNWNPDVSCDGYSGGR